MKKLALMLLIVAINCFGQTIQFTQIQKAIGSGYIPITATTGVMYYAPLSSVIPSTTSLVTYTGATNDVDLGSRFMTANKIGVGSSTAPSYTLDVTGTARVTGSLSVGGDITSNGLQVPTIPLTSSLSVTAGQSLTYSEGTFTPSLSGTGTMPTFTTNTSTYTRIGRTVFFNIYLNNTTGGTAGSGAGQLSITLPFTTASTQQQIRVPIGSSNNGTSEEIIFGTIQSGSNIMLLWKQVNVAVDPEIAILTATDFSDANIRQLSVMSKIIINNP